MFISVPRPCVYIYDHVRVSRASVWVCSYMPGSVSICSCFSMSVFITASVCLYFSCICVRLCACTCVSVFIIASVFLACLCVTAFICLIASTFIPLSVCPYLSLHLDVCIFHASVCVCAHIPVCLYLLLRPCFLRVCVWLHLYARYIYSPFRVSVFITASARL